MAWAVALGLLALGAAMDQREEDMNLNSPAIYTGPLTASELDRVTNPGGIYRTDSGEYLMPAEACTDIGAEPAGTHRDGLLSGLWLRLVRALG